MENREFAKTDEQFKSACSVAGIPATGAQASKWRRGYGLAFKLHQHLISNKNLLVRLESEIKQYEGELVPLKEEIGKVDTKIEERKKLDQEYEDLSVTRDQYQTLVDEIAFEVEQRQTQISRIRDPELFKLDLTRTGTKKALSHSVD